MRVLGFILFFAALLLLGSLGVRAQTVIPTGSATQLTYQRGGYGAELVLAIPARDTTVSNSLFPSYRDSGRICMFAGNLFYHDGAKWVTPSTDSSIYATRYWVDQNYVPVTRTINGYPLSSNVSLTTTDVPEGTNLYFTQSRARQSISVTGGLLSYDNSTGVIGLTNAMLNGSYWALGGNATSATQAMGTTSAQPFTFMTSNLTRGTVSANGSWTLGASTLNTETFLTCRNDQTGRMFFDIGRGATFSTNQFAITFDQTGAGTTFTRISSLGSDMTLQGNTISLLTTAATASTTFLGGDNSSLGGFLKVSVRRPWFGAISFAPTSGTSIAVSWENNSSNTNYTPSSGSNLFIWSRFNPVIMATGTYAGSVEGYVFNPTLTSIANGTVRAFVSNNNIGFANHHSGTAQNYFNGRITQGTQVDNTVDGYQSPNPLRASIIKSTNINQGDLTDSLVVHDDATDEFQKISPITTLISNIDTIVATSSNITMSKRGAYAFSGTTATWTLPASASTPTYYLIKNRGSGDLTIVTMGATNTIYETSAVNSLVVLPTGSHTLFWDGTFWNVKN